jgi:hypothetical protein
MDDEPFLPFETEVFTPEECGWTYAYTGISYIAYEKPNGETHWFEKGKPCLIHRFKGPSDG